MAHDFNIIFMGTSEFAVPVLTLLNHDEKSRIVSVVTQPDRPQGRGRKLGTTPVKKCALAFNNPILQPETVKTDEFFETIYNLQPDVIIVVSFGHILPKRILEIPQSGAVNLHASLLPKYRGPAPIHWSIINGDEETGVTSMLMDKGLDTGDILLVSKIRIAAEDTAGTLHDRLAVEGANLLIKTLDRMRSGNIRPKPQSHGKATYAPMLSKQDGKINWSRPAIEIERAIRGMNPWPGAHTFWDAKQLKLFKAVVSQNHTNLPPGSVIRPNASSMRIVTGEGAIDILEIQGASGKRMLISDFLRGNPFPEGSTLV